MNHSLITTLIQSLSSGSSIYKLCDILANELKNPVAVSLTSETLIGYSSNFTKDFILEFTRSSQFMSSDEVNQMHAQFDKFLPTGKPHAQAWPYLRHKQINCGCLYKNSLIGVLIIPIVYTDLNEIDFDLIEAAARVIALWLATSGYNKSYQPEQNFLRGILLGDTDIAQQRTNLSYIKLSQVTAFRIICVLPKLNSESNFEYQLARFCKKQQQLWHISFQDIYVILINASQDKALSSLELLLKEHGAVGCASDIFTSLSDLKLHFETTKSILFFYASYGTEKTLVSVDEYKLLYILNAARKTAPEHVFHYDKLQEIIRYDSSYATNYLDTLRIYFREQFNFDRIATALNIHKNTAFYRISRIEKLFDINFKNPLQTANLFLALLNHDGIW